jgi:leader peptidase (prepilin peptidase)/N-methyltransferase
VNWPLVGVLAVAGLVVGRGLRAVVFACAVPAGEPVRRACPSCGHMLLPPRNGLSGLTAPAAGHCAKCRARLGPPPLVAELATAVLFGALAARVHPGLVLAAACWLAACAVALACVDAAVARLPDVLTGPAYAGTVLLLVLAAATSGHWSFLVRALLGGAALAAAYLALAVVSRSALGLGDVKLAASLGTLSAWPGWPTLIGGVFAGFLLGAIYGIGLLVSRRARLGQRIPFGPFMIAGTFLAVLASATR